MSPTRKLIVLAACLFLGTVGGMTLAAFSGQTANSGNSFSAANVFPNQLQMASGSYVGTGVDNRNITGLPFQPDVVILKAATNQIGVMRTSTMSGDLAKPLVGATALTANLIQSLTSDGFQLGNNNMVNASGITYYWTAFKAATGVLKVGSYNGNGTSQSITGAGFSPEYVAVMAATNKDAVNRFSGMTNTFDFEDDKGIADRITSLNADGFSVGANDRANASATTYHYVAFNEVAGVIDTGTYSGNATDNRSITGVGFQPNYVMVRANDAATNRKENQKFLAQADPNASFFRADAAYATGIKALESDGFKLGTDGSVNASGVTYHYLAFKHTAGGCATPGDQIVSASEDTWIDEERPTDTHGGEATFKVKSRATARNRRALVKFTLPTIPSNCTMSAVKLRLHASTVEASRTLDVYRNTATWAQATVNWNTQPGTTGTAVSQTMPGAAAWVEWNVMAHVQAMYSGSNYGFHIRDSAENVAADYEQAFDSSESGSDAPQLVITLG